MANNPTFGLPSPTLPIVDPKTGLVSSAWYQFLTRLQQLSAERPFDPITLGPSPYVYTSSTIGNMFVTGGSVASITLTRSGVSLLCPEDVFIPLSANDTLTVIYTAPPTMTFVPSARA